MQRKFVFGLALTVIAAAAASGSSAQSLNAPQNFGVKTMSFDIWCQQTQRLPVDRCRQRRAEDVKAFNDYRDVVERYELQYLKQVQKERNTIDFANRDINSTVLDKATGIR